MCEKNKISPDLKHCPICGSRLTIIRCPCHRWCEKCKKALEVDLSG